VNPYLMTVGAFDRPNAQLFNFPILSRNPWISTVLNYRIYDSRIARSRLQSVAESRDRCVSLATSAGSRTRDASQARALLSGCRKPEHNGSLRAAIYLRVCARRKIP
jgi:hypothetical protein